MRHCYWRGGSCDCSPAVTACATFRRGAVSHSPLPCSLLIACLPPWLRCLPQVRWGLVPSYTKKDERPDFWRMASCSITLHAALLRLHPARWQFSACRGCADTPPPCPAARLVPAELPQLLLSSLPPKCCASLPSCLTTHVLPCPLPNSAACTPSSLPAAAVQRAQRERG